MVLLKAWTATMALHLLPGAFGFLCAPSPAATTAVVRMQRLAKSPGHASFSPRSLTRRWQGYDDDVPSDTGYDEEDIVDTSDHEQPSQESLFLLHLSAVERAVEALHHQGWRIEYPNRFDEVLYEYEYSASPVSIAELKRDLMACAVGVNRGLSCCEGEKEEIMGLIEQLEGQNPCPNPNQGFASDGEAFPLAGEWKLLFTTALDVLSLGLLPGVVVGNVFQNINSDGSEVYNLVELQPATAAVLNGLVGSTMARVKVTAKATLEGDARINLAFARTEYAPQTLFGRDVSVLPPLSLDLPTLQNVGWVDTTYVDDDVRIARARGGYVFVLTRV